MADKQPRLHSAGVFDIRNIIGALLAIYGIVLLLVGFIGGSDTKHVTGADSANIWVGVGLVVVAALFFVWTRWRPIVVDEVELAQDQAQQEREGGAPQR
jgi:uncharacterized membrane protein